MFISISSQTTLINSANRFVFALYDASAPAILLESQAPSKPYGNPLQISFNYNCLNGHIYIITLWKSADTTPSGVVLNSFSQSVNSNVASVTLKTDEYLEADVTPNFTSGQTSYINAGWQGWEYSIERIGMGTMVPDSTIDTNPNYTAISTGGFSLIQQDDVFQSNERFVVRFTPQVVSAPPVSGDPSANFANGRIITADATLTNADVGQALFIQSASTKIIIGLPPISTLADYQFLYIYSNGGSHKNSVFNADVSDKIQYQTIAGTNQVSQIILGQNESIKLFKANGVWNVENDLPGVRGVGEILYTYLYAQMNTLPLAGQLVSRADYPRLWSWVQSLSGSVVTDSVWNNTFITVDGFNYYTRKGYFSTGDGLTTFRLPKIDRYFIRPVDGSIRFPGSFELQSVQIHNHGIDASKVNGTGGFGAVPGVNPGGIESGGNTRDTGSQETIPSNIGAFALIRI